MSYCLYEKLTTKHGGRISLSMAHKSQATIDIPVAMIAYEKILSLFKTQSIKRDNSKFGPVIMSFLYNADFNAFVCKGKVNEGIAIFAGIPAKISRYCIIDMFCEELNPEYNSYLSKTMTKQEAIAFRQGKYCFKIGENPFDKWFTLVSYKLYIVAMVFIFLHELGHLGNAHLYLNQKEKAYFEVNPINRYNGLDIESCQALELNADGYATRRLVELVLFTPEVFSIPIRDDAFSYEDQWENTHENMLNLLFSGVLLVFFLSDVEAHSKMIISSDSHPKPLIRTKHFLTTAMTMILEHEKLIGEPIEEQAARAYRKSLHFINKLFTTLELECKNHVHIFDIKARKRAEEVYYKILEKENELHEILQEKYVKMRKSELKH